MQRVAVIGGGISGLAAAWHLAGENALATVTLFEAADYVGGHTHTVDVTLPDARGTLRTHGVDTGFLVFNHRTYPELRKLFAQLQVATAASEMSFSVQARAQALEWSGRHLAAVFAQPRNLVRPDFYRMLADIARFNRLATTLANAGSSDELTQSIGDFLDQHDFSPAFRQWYFLPMIACIWSCPTQQMLAFPVATLIRFCHNHGLLQVSDRPQWYTVQGGARHYVQAMLDRITDVRLATPVRSVQRAPGGVWLHTDQGREWFDAVIVACHSDQALAIRGPDATALETQVLGAIAYQPNRAVLHTDTALMPKRRLAWAAWNYESASEGDETPAVCLHYWLNRLQPLPFAQDVIVSLNPVREPAPAKVLGEYQYAHPVFDLAARAAQQVLPALQGQHRIWYAGAWTGYGFHEDGLSSALRVVPQVRSLLQGAHLPAAA